MSSGVDTPLVIERPRAEVVVLRMNWPKQLNAMNAELVDALYAAAGRRSVR